MRRRSPRRPNPPLRGRQARRVQLELPRRGIVGGRSLERADRGAVRELGLEVTAQDASQRGKIYLLISSLSRWGFGQPLIGDGSGGNSVNPVLARHLKVVNMKENGTACW